MKKFLFWFTRGAEFVAAMMMAAMFATFILQVFIRYTARLTWVPETFPFLDPGRYGWTLDFTLLMWVWIVFWGNAFIVRQRDHVIFDIIYAGVGARARKWMAIIAAAAVAIGLLLALVPTWDKFQILRLKRTPTLAQLFGDWIRVRDIYIIYIIFLAVVPLRYAYRAWDSFRHGAEADLHHFDELADAPDDSEASGQ